MGQRCVLEMGVVGLDSGCIPGWGSRRSRVIHDSSSVGMIGWLVGRVFNETWEPTKHCVVYDRNVSS